MTLNFPAPSAPRLLNCLSVPALYGPTIELAWCIRNKRSYIHRHSARCCKHLMRASTQHRLTDLPAFAQPLQPAFHFPKPMRLRRTDCDKPKIACTYFHPPHIFALPRASHHFSNISLRMSLHRPYRKYSLQPRPTSSSSADRSGLPVHCSGYSPESARNLKRPARQSDSNLVGKFRPLHRPRL